MTYKELTNQIKQKKSFLAVGLDTDIGKIPKHLLKEEDAMFRFNKAIIDATHDLCISYKLNTAFYEVYASEGWDILKRTIAYIKENYPDIFVIADAKRGDIGNTSTMYAKAVFEGLNADAITLSPYMGRDSIQPFLQFDGKWVILLALTSNSGAADFQFLKDSSNNMELYKSVLSTAQEWGTPENTMFVTGATKAEYFKDIRVIAPKNFLLVPGIGSQGGDLHKVIEYGKTEDIGLIINSSRGIIYASGEKDFAEKAREKALEIQIEMSSIFTK
jgi:orotidine-5'-phosphate decarboxylase